MRNATKLERSDEWSVGIDLKTRDEIERMRRGGARLAEILARLAEAIRPGMRTREIDRLAEDLARRNGGRAAFKGYRAFPASICVSVNEEVVHGIPSERVLAEGDVVSLDFGLLLDGFYTDSAVTVPVGAIGTGTRRLLEVTREALDVGIGKALAGGHVMDIGRSVQGFVESNGYSVIRAYVGHGIGRHLHEDPQVPNFKGSGRGDRLRPGMVLAIEPMTSAGTHEVDILANEWTAVTRDGSLSAHFEHTVAITEEGPRILTLP